jgi:hypothetical protein
METEREEPHYKPPHSPLFFRVLKGAAILHLGLTVCGAAKLVPVPLKFPVGSAIAHYQAYSGSDNGYGFFAPGVASPKRVMVHGYHANKGEWVTTVETGVSRETELRLSTTAGLFSQEKYHEFIAASWAAWMFGNDPDASPVIVEIQVYVIPTMSEFRAGERPQWQTMEVFPFARRSDDKGAP